MRLPTPSKSPDFLQQHRNHHITDLPSPCRDSKKGHHHLIFRRPIYHPRNLATKNCWTLLHALVYSTGTRAHGLTRDSELRSVTLTCAALPMMTLALGAVDVRRPKKKKKNLRKLALTSKKKKKKKITP
jgi:hypothetical protein